MRAAAGQAGRATIGEKARLLGGRRDGARGEWTRGCVDDAAAATQGLVAELLGRGVGDDNQVSVARIVGAIIKLECADGVYAE